MSRSTPFSNCPSCEIWILLFGFLAPIQFTAALLSTSTSRSPKLLLLSVFLLVALSILPLPPTIMPVLEACTRLLIIIEPFFLTPAALITACDDTSLGFLKHTVQHPFS